MAVAVLDRVYDRISLADDEKFASVVPKLLPLVCLYGYLQKSNFNLLVAGPPGPQRCEL